MRAKFINEKFKEESDPVKDMGISAIADLKKRKWIFSNATINEIITTREHKILFYRNMYIILYKDGINNDWRAVTDIYPIDSGSYITSYDIDQNRLIKKVKLAIGKKVNKYERKKKVNEKFSEDSDPIRDIGIGIYRSANYETANQAAKFLIKHLCTILKVDKIPNNIIKKHDDPLLLQNINQKYWPILKEFMMNYIKTPDGRRELSFWSKILSEVLRLLRKKGYPKDVNEAFTEGGDPIRDMGIGVFVKKTYNHANVAAKHIYTNLSDIMKMDKIPDDVIYPIGYVDPKTGVRLAFNSEYLKLITDYLHKYIINDTSFKSQTLRELYQILIMAGYPKNK